MDIVKRNLTDIIPYENNPRKNDQAVDAVAESIRQCGYVAPIIVDENNVILAGHTRLKAMKKLGMTECEVVVKEGLTEEQKKKYRLLDNKTNEMSEWDFDRLIDELEGLDFDGFDFGWGLDDDSGADKEVQEDDYEPLPPVEPVAQRGEIYQLGNHRLMCGDSTDADDIAKLLDGVSADLVITDPPYNVNYGEKMKTIEKLRGKKYANDSDIANDNMGEEQFNDFMMTVYQRLNEAMRPGAAIYVFHSDTMGHIFRQTFMDAGLKLAQCLIWEKDRFVLGRQDYQWKHEPILYGWKEGAAHYFVDDRAQSTILLEDEIDYKSMKKDELVKYLEELRQGYQDRTTVIHENKPLKNDMHPTMKPITLIGKLMKNSSQPGWSVLDVFGGSGSTLMAAEQLDRTSYTMELEPKYIDVIIDRWERFTGQKAVLIGEKDV